MSTWESHNIYIMLEGVASLQVSSFSEGAKEVARVTDGQSSDVDSLVLSTMFRRRDPVREGGKSDSSPPGHRRPHVPAQGELPGEVSELSMAPVT
eukprot:748897-Hanusia_phi.AAC.2